jgi:hypothetical protein
MAVPAALLIGGATAVLTGLLGKGIQARTQKKESESTGVDAFGNKAAASAYRNAALQKGADIFQNRQEAYDAYASMVDQRREDYANQLAMSQEMAMQGLPEETKQLMIDQTNQASMNAMAGAESARGSLGAASRAQQSANDAYRQLASMDATQRLQNKQAFINAQGQYANNMGALDANMLNAQNQLADYEQQAFVDPLNQEGMFYRGQSQQGTDYQRALQGARMQNVQGIYGDLFNLGGQAIQYGATKKGQ